MFFANQQVTLVSVLWIIMIAKKIFEPRSIHFSKISTHQNGGADDGMICSALIFIRIGNKGDGIFPATHPVCIIRPL
jgi:hypothetical protein